MWSHSAVVLILMTITKEGVVTQSTTGAVTPTNTEVVTTTNTGEVTTTNTGAVTATNTGAVTPTNTGAVTTTNTEAVTTTNTGAVTPTNTGAVTTTNTGAVTTTNTEAVTATNTEAVTTTNTGAVTPSNTGAVTTTNTEAVTTTNTGAVTPTNTGAVTTTNTGAVTTTNTEAVTTTNTGAVTTTNTEAVTTTNTEAVTTTNTGAATTTNTGEVTATNTEAVTTTYTGAVTTTELVTLPVNYLECYPNQTIKFTNPDSGLYTYYKAFYDAAGPGTDTDCVVAADDSNNYAFMDCASTTATVTLYISDRDLSGDNNILSRHSTTFTFRCMTETSHNRTLSNALNVNISETAESDTPEYNITSAFFDESGNLVTQATVGDLVYYVIIGPAEYSLKPLQCNATGDNNENAILITDGCSNDYGLFHDFTETTVGQENHYNVSLNVFKFYKSDTLTVTCNVEVCSGAGDCSFTCYGPERRKREITITNEVKRDVSDASDDYKTSMTGNTLRIVDVALGGSATKSGSAQCLISMLMLLFTMFW